MPIRRWFALCLLLWISQGTVWGQELDLQLRYQQPVSAEAAQYHRLVRKESWKPQQTAVIVCDMWDAHHCLNAVRRVTEVAPRIDAFVRELRSRGVTVIHAPSSCMEHYAEHPARHRAEATRASDSIPTDMQDWCDQIDREQEAPYPIDQAAGGEDDDPTEHRQWAARLTAEGRDPRAPWLAQTAAIAIDAKQDYISDSGPQIWSILAEKGISNIILVGVHTNMCVLGRPFGLRRLAMAGKNVVLARDLTDTMYDPKAWPYVDHFTGTDLIVSHIERTVCPTISSDQIIGGGEFRYSGDQRLRLALLIAEDEYHTEDTLPPYAAMHLGSHFSVTPLYAREDEPSQIEGIADIASYDAMLISVRRRPLPEADLRAIRDFVALGKPMIGIRTASHAFALRDGRPAAGLAQWPEIDAEVWGGSYSGHHPNDVPATLVMDSRDNSHSIMAAANLSEAFHPGGSLYKTAPLLPGAESLIMAAVPKQEPQPLAWTFVRKDGGRSFYTSLGHVDDFSQLEFQALLSAGIHWACGLETPRLEHVAAQKKRHESGYGKQRE